MIEELGWKWKRKDFDWKRLIKKLDFELDETERKARFELEEKERTARLEMEEKEKRARFEMEENDKKAACDLELRKLEVERERLALAEREQIRKHGLRTQGIRVDEVGHTEDTDSFRMSAAIKFVPKFQEQDLEQFLLNFEKSMEIHNFPKDKWTALIHTKLTGKASKVFSALSTEQCKDNDVVKAALLTAYSRIPEFYRKKFRNLTRGHLETFSNFAFRLQLPFHSWIDGANVANDADKLKELFKLEQFVNCLPKDIRKSVLERHPTSLMEAAKLADEYEVLTRPFKMDAPELSNWHNKFKGNGEWRKSQQNSSSSNDYVWQSPFRNNNSTSADNADTNSNWRRPNQNKSPPRDSNRSGGSRPNSPKASGGRTICGFCSKAGHSMARCYILHPNLRPQGGRNNEEASDTVNLVSLGVNQMSMHENECTVQDNYKAFCVYANVHSLGNDQRLICLLRDSGASRSVASQGQLHQGEYIHTGEVRLIQGVVGQAVSVPLVEILIELNGRKQWILCGLVPSLPQDISVIIGNDYSNLLPVSVGVVTRGMVRKQRTGKLDSCAKRVQARQSAVNLQRSPAVDLTSRSFMQSNVFQGLSNASVSNGSVVSPTDVSHANQLTAVDSELEGISESSVNELDDGNDVACANSTLGLHSDELDESVEDELVGVSELYSTLRDFAILQMLHVASNGMSTLQSNDESQKDVVVLVNGELTVADQALCHNDNDALNDDDMGVVAVSNVMCLDDVSSTLNNNSHGAIFTSDDGDQRIVDVFGSEASGCVVNDIACGIDEVTSHVLIPSLVQLAKTVLGNMVSVDCDIRHTSSVMQVLSDTVLYTEVRDACVRVDIHDLLAYHLPDTFSCFHGVFVSSVTDETVIKQLVVKFDGQGQVGDGNILLTDSSQLVSDLLVSDVIDAG